MAINPPRIGANHMTKVIKASALRLSDEMHAGTEDYAEILVGDGVPSGGYGRASGASLIWIRKDASGVDVVLYVSPDGGTTWNAVESSGLGSDAGLTSLVAADAAAGLPYVSAANTWAMLTLAADKGIRATAAGTLVTFDLTAAGLALLDDADASAQRTTLGLAIGTNVQAYSAILAALVTYGLDTNVLATIAVADSPGGATGSACTIQLKRLDNSTAIASARQVLVYAMAGQYDSGQSDASPTFGSATTGSIVASGNGWALIETDATGAAAFTISNSTDETLYFAVRSGVVADLTKACTVVGSNSDAATWSA